MEVKEGVILGVRGAAGCLGINRMTVVLYYLINKKMENVKDVVLTGYHPAFPLFMGEGDQGEWQSHWVAWDKGFGGWQWK